MADEKPFAPLLSQNFISICDLTLKTLDLILIYKSSRGHPAADGARSATLPDNLSLHVHDGHGVGSAADDQVFGVLGQEVDAVDVEAPAGRRATEGLEGADALARFGVPDFDGSVGRGADDVVAVDGVDGVVDVGRVAAELLQGFARLEAVASDRCIERGAQNLQTLNELYDRHLKRLMAVVSSPPTRSSQIGIISLGMLRTSQPKTVRCQHTRLEIN